MAQAPVAILVIIGLILSFEYIVFFDTTTAADGIVEGGPFEGQNYGGDLATSEVSGGPAVNETEEGGGLFGTILQWTGTALICAGAVAAAATGVGAPIAIGAAGLCGAAVVDLAFFGGAASSAIGGFIIATAKFVKSTVLGLPEFVALMIRLLSFDIIGAPVWARFAFALPINGGLLYAVIALVRGN